MAPFLFAAALIACGSPTATAATSATSPAQVAAVATDVEEISLEISALM